MNQKGFTMVEMLTVVLILAVLVVMAVPMYEKAIERSHVAEARAVLKQLLEAKLRLMGDMGRDHYALVTESSSPGSDPTITVTPSFGFERLDMKIKCTNDISGEVITCRTKDFKYTLLPNYQAGMPVASNFIVDNADVTDAVCAARCGGDYHNTAFLYVGELSKTFEKMFCTSSQKEGCALFNMEDVDAKVPWCTCDAEG